MCDRGYGTSRWGYLPYSLEVNDGVRRIPARAGFCGLKLHGMHRISACVGSRPVSRVLSRTVIHLEYALPHTSSDLPGSSCGPHAAAGCPLPYLVLLQVGFTLPLMLPPARCALTAPFHPYPLLLPAPSGAMDTAPSGELRQDSVAVCFLWHWPWARAPQELPGTLPGGARTFLRIPQDAATVQPTPYTTITQFQANVCCSCCEPSVG